MGAAQVIRGATSGGPWQQSLSHRGRRARLSQFGTKYPGGGQRRVGAAAAGPAPREGPRGPATLGEPKREEEGCPAARSPAWRGSG